MNDSAIFTEADTCREYVTPAIKEAGWGAVPHAIGEQHAITAGRILVVGKKTHRAKLRRADYILYFKRDFPVAVIEAKELGMPAENGVQQAREYAEMLGLRFAYATNGKRIIEIDYTTGREHEVTRYPTPDELWQRLQVEAGLTPEAAERWLEPYNLASGKEPRYYQDLAIRRVVGAILNGRKRILATLATGTGKTVVAFQICWKLWSSRWNLTGEYRRPKILFLADRNILVDDPKDKTFAPFGDARHKLTSRDPSLARDMYFGIYQSLTNGADEDLFRQYRPNFFDLIIVDECHRGSSRDDSSWRRVLDYFTPAVQFGMTATPLRDDTRDSYAYFGNPVYTYSLRQGIEDGFLAPYRVHRVITSVDAAGWRPSKSELDRYGRPIPDDEYQTKDFERVIAMRARTQAMARHLTDYLKSTDRFAKTLVFCVDQEHAAEMRQALINLNSDLVQQYPDYVCRVTADEGDIGLAHLSNFQDVDRLTPAILTTSQLLSTGVNAETVKNVVLARVVGSMVEFKQIIGRGTRLRVDYGKEYFNIIDFTGTATRHFADPDFDGEPAQIDEIAIDENGNTQQEYTVKDGDEPPEHNIITEPDTLCGEVVSDLAEEPRKFYVDGGRVEVIGYLVYDLDADGKKLEVVRYTDYSARTIRSMYLKRGDLETAWRKPDTRKAVLDALAERQIDFAELASATGQPDADPFDLLCHLAWNTPLRTRRERAEQARKVVPDLFAEYGDTAREIIGLLLDRYIERGVIQFNHLSDLLKVQPFNRYGSPSEIATRYFGNVHALRAAVTQLQTALYP